jgi:uncharacterized protein (TIGR00730 family)
MGAVAGAAFEAGAPVTGVIPAHLYEREQANLIPGKVFIVDSMHKRKELMYYLSAGFAVLPGGLGTMDEVMEVATWNKLGLHEKPVVLVNFHGFFDPLLGMLDHLVMEGFVGTSERSLIHDEPDAESALKLIEDLADHPESAASAAPRP